MKKVLIAFLIAACVLQATSTYKSPNKQYSRSKSRPYKSESVKYNSEYGQYNSESMPYNSEYGRYKSESVPYKSESVKYMSEYGQYNSESIPHNSEYGQYKSESMPYNSEYGQYNSKSMPYNSEYGQYKSESEPYKSEPYKSESVKYNSEYGLYKSKSGPYKSDDYRVTYKGSFYGSENVFYQKYGLVEGIDVISYYNNKTLIKTYSNYDKSECYDKCLYYNCFLVIYKSYSCSIYNQAAQSYLIKSDYPGIVYVRLDDPSSLCVNTNRIIPSNLVEYWPICGSTKNYVSENDLAINLGYLTNDKYDNLYSAYQINNGFGQVPPGNYFNYDWTVSGTGFSIMFWMRLLTLPVSGAVVLEFDSSDNARTNSIMIYFDSNQKLVFDSYVSGAATKTISTTTAFAINIWYHITFTVSVTTAVSAETPPTLAGTWYVNGFAETGTATGTDLLVNNIEIRAYNYIGLSITRNSPGLDAVIDELKFFSAPLAISDINAEKLKRQPYQIVTLEYVNVYNLPSSYTTGLTFYWPLSNNFVDYINYKDLIDYSNNAFTFDRFDTPNAALFLDSSYLRAPTYNYFSNGGFTIMTWIKVLHPTGISKNEDLLTVLDFGDGCNYNNIKFQLKRPNGDSTAFKVRFQTYSGGIAGGLFTSTGTINIGEWHHIAVSYESATVVKIFIDGSAQAASSGTFTLPSIFTSNINLIGRSCDEADSNDLTAVIDELKIFNRGQISVSTEMNVKEPFLFTKVKNYNYNQYGLTY